MKYLFDASSIFRSIKENKIDLLAGNHTIELARYELGNIVWKDYYLQAKISAEEFKKLAKTIRRSLAVMDVLQIGGNEEEILEIATNLKISFYDASYAYVAKAKELRLITEDLRLTKRITPAIDTSTLDDIEQQNAK